MKLQHIGNRQKQAVGALALLRFCEEYSIHYKGIKELIDHLFQILISDDLPNWEAEGLKLEIIGRGEPLPKKLDSILNLKIVEDFYRLIDNVIEIGIIDLYGANTNAPYDYMCKTLDILAKHNINVTIPHELLSTCKSRWGDVWDIQQFNEFREHDYILI